MPDNEVTYDASELIDRIEAKLDGIDQKLDGKASADIVQALADRVSALERKQAAAEALSAFWRWVWPALMMTASVAISLMANLRRG